MDRAHRSLRRAIRSAPPLRTVEGMTTTQLAGRSRTDSRGSRGLAPAALLAVTAVFLSPLLASAGIDPFVSAMSGPLAGLLLLFVGLRIFGGPSRRRGSTRPAPHSATDPERKRSNDASDDRTARRRPLVATR